MTTGPTRKVHRKFVKTCHTTLIQMTEVTHVEKLSEVSSKEGAANGRKATQMTGLHSTSIHHMSLLLPRGLILQVCFLRPQPQQKSLPCCIYCQ